MSGRCLTAIREIPAVSQVRAQDNSRELQRFDLLNKHQSLTSPFLQRALTLSKIGGGI